MSKAKLKKHLLSLTKEQITDIVFELYDARKEAKDYLELYLAPDCNAELEKSKKAIRNVFFPSRGFCGVSTSRTSLQCLNRLGIFDYIRNIFPSWIYSTAKPVYAILSQHSPPHP